MPEVIIDQVNRLLEMGVHEASILHALGALQVTETIRDKTDKLVDLLKSLKNVECRYDNITGNVVVNFDIGVKDTLLHITDLKVGLSQDKVYRAEILNPDTLYSAVNLDSDTNVLSVISALIIHEVGKRGFYVRTKLKDYFNESPQIDKSVVVDAFLTKMKTRNIDTANIPCDDNTTLPISYTTAPISLDPQAKLTPEVIAEESRKIAEETLSELESENGKLSPALGVPDFSDEVEEENIDIVLDETQNEEVLDESESDETDILIANTRNILKRVKELYSENMVVKLLTDYGFIYARASQEFDEITFDYENGKSDNLLGTIALRYAMQNRNTVILVDGNTQLDDYIRNNLNQCNTLLWEDDLFDTDVPPRDDKWALKPILHQIFTKVLSSAVEEVNIGEGGQFGVNVDYVRLREMIKPGIDVNGDILRESFDKELFKNLPMGLTYNIDEEHEHCLALKAPYKRGASDVMLITFYMNENGIECTTILVDTSQELVDASSRHKYTKFNEWTAVFVTTNTVVKAIINYVKSMENQESEQ